MFDKALNSRLSFLPFIFRYVSDYGYNSYKSYCQQKLLCWNKDSTGRLFPPTLLEWKSLKESTNLSLECEMPDSMFKLEPVLIDQKRILVNNKNSDDYMKFVQS